MALLTPDGIREENQMLLDTLEMSNWRMEVLDNAVMQLLNTTRAMLALVQRHQHRVAASHAFLYQAIFLPAGFGELIGQGSVDQLTKQQ